MEERSSEVTGRALTALLGAVDATRAAADVVAEWVELGRPDAASRLGLEPGRAGAWRDAEYDARLDLFGEIAKAHSAAKRALVAWQQQGGAR